MRADLFTPSSALGKPPAWRTKLASFLIHLALISIIIFVPFRSKVLEDPKMEVVPVELSPYKIVYPPAGKDKPGGGGGGGERKPELATKGRLPRFSMQQLSPPSLIRNPNPKLPVEPTVIVPPDIQVPNPEMPNYGDPLAKLITDSQGPGSSGGFGTGEGGGVGSGFGPGVGPGWGGGIGGGAFWAGAGGASYATCLYCPKPLYTEEARKAKFSGTFILRVIIDPDGKARKGSEKVIKAVGLGLDENAVRAVMEIWRFKPGELDGKPVPVWQDIEVNYRIY